MLKKASIALISGLIIAGLVASIAGAATGKVAGKRKMGAQAPVARFARALDLTPEQTQQVNVILQRLKADVLDVAASQQTPQEKQTKVLQLRASAKDNIRSILTIDQRNKADEGRLIDRLLTPRKVRGMTQVLARLNLSEDQKAKVHTIVQDAAVKAKAVRADTSLTPQVKKTRMMEIRKGSIDSISAILTPEQRTKFQQGLQSKRGMRK